MGRIARPLTGPRAQQNDDLERRETDRRVSAALGGSQRIVARHTWTYSGTGLSSNTDYDAAWSRVRDDGIATASGITVTPNAPGIWYVGLQVYSDSSAAGHMLTLLRMMGYSGAEWFDGLDALRNSQYRGSGFSLAGRVDQFIGWTGPLTDAEAAAGIGLRFRNSAAATATTFSVQARLQLNYLGTATFADVGGYEADPTS